MKGRFFFPSAFSSRFFFWQQGRADCGRDAKIRAELPPFAPAGCQLFPFFFFFFFSPAEIGKFADSLPGAHGFGLAMSAFFLRCVKTAFPPSEAKLGRRLRADGALWPCLFFLRLPQRKVGISPLPRRDSKNIPGARQAPALCGSDPPVVFSLSCGAIGIPVPPVFPGLAIWIGRRCRGQFSAFFFTEQPSENPPFSFAAINTHFFA